MLNRECRKKITVTLMLCIAAVFFTLASAQAEDEMGTMDLSKAKIAKVAKFIAKIQKSEKSVEEITVLATDKDGNVTKIASTTASEVGRPSDPEDIDAIIDNKVVPVVEGDSIDVTVPIPNAAGLPAAIAGTTLSLKDGLSKKDAVAKAVAIGKKIDEILIK